jgi:hypothetical protein
MPAPLETHSDSYRPSELDELDPAVTLATPDKKDTVTWWRRRYVQISLAITMALAGVGAANSSAVAADKNAETPSQAQGVSPEIASHFLAQMQRSTPTPTPSSNPTPRPTPNSQQETTAQPLTPERVQEEHELRVTGTITRKKDPRGNHTPWETMLLQISPETLAELRVATSQGATSQAGKQDMGLFLTLKGEEETEIKTIKFPLSILFGEFVGEAVVDLDVTQLSTIRGEALIEPLKEALARQGLQLTPEDEALLRTISISAGTHQGLVILNISAPTVSIILTAANGSSYLMQIDSGLLADGGISLDLQRGDMLPGVAIYPEETLIIGQMAVSIGNDDKIVTYQLPEEMTLMPPNSGSIIRPGAYSGQSMERVAPVVPSQPGVSPGTARVIPVTPRPTPDTPQTQAPPNSQAQPKSIQATPESPGSIAITSTSGVPDPPEQALNTSDRPRVNDSRWIHDRWEPGETVPAVEWWDDMVRRRLIRPTTFANRYILEQMSEFKLVPNYTGPIANADFYGTCQNILGPILRQMEDERQGTYDPNVIGHAPGLSDGKPGDCAVIVP